MIAMTLLPRQWAHFSGTVTFFCGVASPDEVAAFRPAIASAVTRFSRESRPLVERDTYGKAFLQVMNLWSEDSDVRRFVLAARFAGVAANLLGAQGVRMYHDQALVKEPGGGHTPWHQNAIYWPIDGTRCSRCGCRSSTTRRRWA